MNEATVTLGTNEAIWSRKTKGLPTSKLELYSRRLGIWLHVDTKRKKSALKMAQN